MKYGNRVWRWRRFQRPIVSLWMLSMHLRIIQQRGWRILTWRDCAQQLGIPLKQGVDGLGHLTGHATDDTFLANIGLGALVVWACGFDQAIVEVRPFMVLQADRLEDGQEQYLLHRPGSSPRQPGMIQGAPRLSQDRSPTEVGFECGCQREVVDRANSGDDRGCHHRPNSWERQEDLPFACVFDNARDFVFQLLDVLTQQSQLFDQLALLQHEPLLPSDLFDTDADAAAKRCSSSPVSRGLVLSLPYKEGGVG